MNSKVVQMLLKINNRLKNIFKHSKSKSQKIDNYIRNGRIPWSEGYDEYKWTEIEKSINDEDTLKKFKENAELNDYGIGLDERIIEYPWIISNLADKKCKLLDAGSTFNYQIILNQKIISLKNKTITTYFPEKLNFNELGISYVYSDLREVPFKDEYFDEIVCQSTIEHIGMDNSIYGYKTEDLVSMNLSKNYQFIIAINELLRLLKHHGLFLLTFPFGVFENHGFFQQFDDEMTVELLKILNIKGSSELFFFRYTNSGWKPANQNECGMLRSYNPHTGIGKGSDNAAHCRGICCIKFTKN